MPNIRKAPFQVLVALDQLFNTLCGGWADETFSARCWRCRASKWWNRGRRVLDALFFWQKAGHCRLAYEAEVARAHQPPALRTFTGEVSPE